MKIVVLDGYTTNPGDLCWDKLKELGECTIYDRTAPGEVLERAAGAEALLTNKVVINSEMMAALPDLKYIGVMATGYNVVDIEAARKHGIPVCNIPAYSTRSVAQMVFALLLAITNRVEHYAEENRKGRWSRNPDFCYWDTPLMELSGKKMGIVGLGHTGMATARIALAFGMEVYACTSKSPLQLGTDIRKSTMEELFSACDVISLNCPLTPETHHLVNPHTLALMTPGAILINTGRGRLIHTNALIEGLKTKKVGYAGLDVYEEEGQYFYEDKSDKIIDDDTLARLLSFNNVIVTSHQAFFTKEAMANIAHTTLQNVKDFAEGRPLVNEVVAS